MVLCIKWRGLYTYAGMVIPGHLLDRICELKTLVQQNFLGSLAVLPGKTTVGLHTPERIRQRFGITPTVRATARGAAATGASRDPADPAATAAPWQGPRVALAELDLVQDISAAAAGPASDAHAVFHDEMQDAELTDEQVPLLASGLGSPRSFQGLPESTEPTQTRRQAHTLDQLADVRVVSEHFNQAKARPDRDLCIPSTSAHDQLRDMMAQLADSHAPTEAIQDVFAIGVSVNQDWCVSHGQPRPVSIWGSTICCMHAG